MLSVRAGAERRTVSADTTITLSVEEVSRGVGFAHPTSHAEPNRQELANLKPPTQGVNFDDRHQGLT